MRRIFCLTVMLLALTQLAQIATADPEFKWIYNSDGGDSRTDIGQFALTTGDGDLILGALSTPLGEQVNSVIKKIDRLTGEPVWSTWYSSGGENEIVLNGLVWDGYGDLIVGEYIQACVG